MSLGFAVAIAIIAGALIYGAAYAQHLLFGGWAGP
jgi:hypothetical protein